MNKKKIDFIVQAALIAAVYAALTYAAGALGLAYGNIQFRFSEALTILAAFTPAAIPGLTIGCFLGNLGSPFGMVDILCGTFATFLAAVLAYYTRKITVKGLPILSALFPVITNAVIVGLEITLLTPGNSGFDIMLFLVFAGEVALGEIAMCYGLGLPLAAAVKKNGADKFLR